MRCVAFAAAVFVAGVASADTAKVRAEKLFEDGRRYLAAKEYALACTAFEQSQAADPAIGTQLNIALCYEEWGKTASAYRAYVEAERLAKEKLDARADGARNKVDALARTVPRLRLDLPEHTDPSVVILFDKQELAVDKLADELLVDPGAHELETRIAGKPPRSTRIDMGLGEHKTFTIDAPARNTEDIAPHASARSTPRLYGGIAMMSAGAVAIGVASALALAARQDYNDAIVDCPQNLCTSRAAFDATQDARRRANYMTIVGAGGVVLAGVGLYLALTSRGSAEQPKTAQVMPIVGLDEVGLAIGGPL